MQTSRSYGALALALGAWLVLSACASAPPTPPPAKVPSPVVLAPPPLPLASEVPLAEWLPAGSVLAARIDVAALEKTGPLAALLEVWLGDDSVWLEQARRAYVGVEPVAASERVVLVIEAEAAPASTASASWTAIARDAWVACVRACDGYAVARALQARPSDVRAGLFTAPVEGELAVAYAGELLDDTAPAKLALRDRLLDTLVSVSSELRDASLRMSQGGNTLTTEFRARFTSRGVASSASLLARGAVFEAADELERVGLTREADLLYALTLTLGEVDDMTAKLSVPLDAVPTLATAWLVGKKLASKKSEPEALQQ